MNRANGSGVDFFASEETVTFELGDGYWVELKRELDYGEENELEGAAIRAGVAPGAVGGVATPTLEYSIRNQRSLMLALYIVEWNITDRAGRVVALPHALSQRQQIVDKLSPSTARKIVGRIEQLRIEAAAPGIIDLAKLEGAEVNPTQHGPESGDETLSTSPNGSEAPVIEMSSEHRNQSSEIAF